MTPAERALLARALPADGPAAAIDAENQAFAVAFEHLSPVGRRIISLVMRRISDGEGEESLEMLQAVQAILVGGSI